LQHRPPPSFQAPSLDDLIAEMNSISAALTPAKGGKD
jgi:hypothetical protein